MSIRVVLVKTAGEVKIQRNNKKNNKKFLNPVIIDFTPMQQYVAKYSVKKTFRICKFFCMKNSMIKCRGNFNLYFHTKMSDGKKPSKT